MSLALGFPSTPTQCQNLTISWSGPAGTPKTIQAFVQGTNYFMETLDNGADLTGAAGVLGWTVDLPAGLSIAIEIRNPSNVSQFATSPFVTILPGSTDACFQKNTGQLATDSAAALEASLSSVSPQLFTYAATTTTSSSSSSTATTKTTTSTSSDSATVNANSTTSSSTKGSITTSKTVAPKSSSSSSSSSTNSSSSSSAVGASVDTTGSHKSSSPGGAIAGGVAGAVALALFALAGYWFYRRRQGRNGSQITEKTTLPSTSSSGGAGIVTSERHSRNPIEAWRSRQATRPPSTGTFVYSPASPILDEYHHSSSTSASQSFPSTNSHSYDPSPFAGGFVPSVGPRPGVPEVQDTSIPMDGFAFRGAASSGANSDHSHSYRPVNSNASMGSLPRTGQLGQPQSFYNYNGAPEVMEEDHGGMTEGGGYRPPTRLTTPGASIFGVETVDHGYQTYGR